MAEEVRTAGRTVTAGLALLVALPLSLAAPGAAAADSDPAPEQVEGRVAAMASSIAGTEDGPIAPPSVSLLLRLDDG